MVCVRHLPPQAQAKHPNWLVRISRGFSIVGLGVCASDRGQILSQKVRGESGWSPADGTPTTHPAPTAHGGARMQRARSQPAEQSCGDRGRQRAWPRSPWVPAMQRGWPFPTTYEPHAEAAQESSQGLLCMTPVLNQMPRFYRKVNPFVVSLRKQFL